MKSRRALAIFLVVWLGVLFPGSMKAAPPQILPLEIKDGKPTGAGADLIRVELPKAQFILWGEDHGFADSPTVLRAIAREARPFGFTRHVVEVGPLSTQMIADTLARDGLPGLQPSHDAGRQSRRVSTRITTETVA